MPKNVAFHQTKVDVTTVASTLLPLNSNRTYLLIQNLGVGTIFLNFSGTAVDGEGIYLASLEAYEHYIVPTDAISVIGDGSATVIVVEA